MVETAFGLLEKQITIMQDVAISLELSAYSYRFLPGWQYPPYKITVTYMQKSSDESRSFSCWKITTVTNREGPMV